MDQSAYVEGMGLAGGRRFGSVHIHVGDGGGRRLVWISQRTFGRWEWSEDGSVHAHWGRWGWSEVVSDKSTYTGGDGGGRRMDQSTYMGEMGEAGIWSRMRHT